MPGARPGLSSSGLRGAAGLGVGRTTVALLTLPIRGMQPGDGSGPPRTMSLRRSARLTKRWRQLRLCGASASRIVTVTVRPETSGTPGGTSVIRMRTGTRWASRTQVYTGSTFGRPWVLGAALETLIPTRTRQPRAKRGTKNGSACKGPERCETRRRSSSVLIYRASRTRQYRGEGNPYQIRQRHHEKPKYQDVNGND
jgi:hypothetical protein